MRVDVAKLARIALCFAGVLMIVSGIESGLTSLANRVLLASNAQTRDVVFYIVGMILFCPLAFGKAAIGLCCIRFNKSLVRFCEKYSRKQVRIGSPSWRLSEVHALCCVFFGMYVLYCGIVDIMNGAILFINMASYYGITNTATWFAFFIPAALFFYLAPGGLLIRFAKTLTAMIGKKLAK